MFDVKVITNQVSPSHLNHNKTSSRQQVRQACNSFRIGCVVRSSFFDGFGKVIGYNISGYGRHFASLYPLLVKDSLGHVHTCKCDEVEVVVLSK